MAKKIEILENTLLKLLVRRGTDTDRKQVILSEGELGYTTDTERLFIGNGGDAGGTVVGNKFLGCDGAPAETFSEAITGDLAFNSSTKYLCAFKGNSEWDLIATVNDGRVDAGDFNASSIGNSLEIDGSGAIALDDVISINTIGLRSNAYLSIPQTLSIGGPQYTFPTNSGSNGNVLTTDGNGGLQWAPAGLPTTALFNSEYGNVPPGVIVPFATSTPPQGWLVCDGQSYQGIDYPELSAAIGTNYGGNSTSFNVPNFTNKSLYGTTDDPASSEIYGVVDGVTPIINDNFKSFGEFANRANNSTFYATSFFISQDGDLFAAGNGDSQEIMGYARDYLAGFNKVAIPFTSVDEKVQDYYTSGQQNPSLYVLSDKGRLYSVGWNSVGQLGLGNTTERREGLKQVNIPTLKFFTTSISHYEDNNGHCLAITSDDKLYTWGNNTNGQLGLGNTTQRTTPIEVNTSFLGSAVPVKAVASNNYGCSFIIDSNGEVWSCGYNVSGQLGLGNTTQQTTFQKVTLPQGVFAADIHISVSSSQKSVFIITTDGDVYSAGDNGSGGLGRAGTTNQSSFGKVDLGTEKVSQLCTSGTNGNAGVIVLTQNKTLRVWGYNTNGRLGTGNTNNVTNGPVTPANNPQNVVKVKMQGQGNSYSVFINESGQVWAAGYNNQGQLGDGTITNKSVFTKATLQSGVKAVDLQTFGSHTSFATFIATDKNEIMAAGDAYAFTTGQVFRAEGDASQPLFTRVSVHGERPNNTDVTYSTLSSTGVTYIIKAIPDEVLDTSLSVTSNLTASLDGISQVLPFNYLTGDIEIGLQPDVSLTSIGAQSINTSTLQTESVQFIDGTIQTSAPKITPYWNVLNSKNNARTTPAQMRSDRLNGNFNGEWSEFSRGNIDTGYNNVAYASTNSLMYTMWVNNTGSTTKNVIMYNYSNDDAIYIYVDDSLEWTGSNISTVDARIADFDIPTGIHRIDIIKNDSGNGSNQIELYGNIISGDIEFVEDAPYPIP